MSKVLKILARLLATTLLCLFAVVFAASEAPRTDSAPQIISRVNPQYPFEMRRAGVSGEVTVDFVVDVNGRPTKITVAKSSRKEFEAPAIAAVEKWKFKPGTKDGKPVETHMRVPLYFNLGKK